MVFWVTALTDEGKRHRGMYEVDDPDRLLEMLEQKQLAPLNIRELPEVARYFRLQLTSSKITKEEIVELLENMHVMFQAGVPLHLALQDLAEDNDNQAMASMLRDIAAQVNTGIPISQACSPYEKHFTPVAINLMRIGEETGQIQETLLRAGEFIRKTEDLKKKTKKALIYPTFSFLGMIGALSVWIIYVLPQLAGVFLDMGVELPLMTRLLIALSDVMGRFMLGFLATVAVLGVSFNIAYKRSERFRFLIHRILLRMPVISTIITSFNIAFICEYLRLSLVSGLTLYDALATIQQNLQNLVFRYSMGSAREQIAQGTRFSTALGMQKVYTPFTLRMLNVGEDSGMLDNQLQVISTYYYRRVDDIAENIGKIIEPMVIAVVGGFMALIMLSLMGPIYDLISATG